MMVTASTSSRFDCSVGTEALYLLGCGSFICSRGKLTKQLADYVFVNTKNQQWWPDFAPFPLNSHASMSH